MLDEPIPFRQRMPHSPSKPIERRRMPITIIVRIITRRINTKNHKKKKKKKNVQPKIAEAVRILDEVVGTCHVPDVLTPGTPCKLLNLVEN